MSKSQILGIIWGVDFSENLRHQMLREATVCGWEFFKMARHDRILGRDPEVPFYSPRLSLGHPFLPVNPEP